MNVITTNEVERRNNRFVMAAARGNKKEFQQCVEQGQEVSVMHSMMNYTALHAAAEFGTTEIITALCDMGMAVNVRDLRVGQTPLHYAAAAGKIEVALLLLSRGSDRKIGCNRGQLPFELAEEEGHTEMCEFLKYRPPEIVHFVTLRCTETTITGEHFFSPLFLPFSSPFLAILFLLLLSSKASHPLSPSFPLFLPLPLPSTFRPFHPFNQSRGNHPPSTVPYIRKSWNSCWNGLLSKKIPSILLTLRPWGRWHMRTIRWVRRYNGSTELTLSR